MIKEKGNISKIVTKLHNKRINRFEHSYKSWLYCHNHFLKIKNNKVDNNDIDIACLQLHTFLANWGMFRGKAFIGNKTYKFHKEIVKEIIDQKYNKLWNIEKNINSDNLNTIFQQLVKNIKRKIKKLKNKDNTSGSITWTLITKIILGTVGCIPAYDRYFKEGISETQNIQKTFNPSKSFIQILEFYRNNEKVINSIINEIGSTYTPMYIIDKYFWVLGRDKS